MMMGVDDLMDAVARFGEIANNAAKIPEEEKVKDNNK